MKKNYELQLPAGYRAAMVVDAKNVKFGILMNVAAFLIMLAVIVPAVLLIRPAGFFAEENIFANMLRCGFLSLSMILYLVLHELTHGLAYKLLTKQKLTFGITLSVAYCGVPNIFVYRKAALISLLAPFLVFLPVFLLPVFFLENPWNQLVFVILLASHVGGCAGDLYDTLLYLFRFRSPDTLMQDTGPKQTFYVKSE